MLRPITLLYFHLCPRKILDIHLCIYRKQSAIPIKKYYFYVNTYDSNNQILYTSEILPSHFLRSFTYTKPSSIEKDNHSRCIGDWRQRLEVGKRRQVSLAYMTLSSRGDASNKYVGVVGWFPHCFTFRQVNWEFHGRIVLSTLLVLGYRVSFVHSVFRAWEKAKELVRLQTKTEKYVPAIKFDDECIWDCWLIPFVLEHFFFNLKKTSRLHTS